MMIPYFIYFCFSIIFITLLLGNPFTIFVLVQGCSCPYNLKTIRQLTNPFEMRGSDRRPLIKYLPLVNTQLDIKYLVKVEAYLT